jgi:hypothetical protein
VLANQSIVGSEFQHIVSRQGESAVEAELIRVLRDGPPLLRVDFERGFFFPVLDKVLEKEFDRVWSPVCGLGGFKCGIGSAVIWSPFVAPFGF